MKAIDKNTVMNGEDRLDWATGFLCVAYQFVYRVLGSMIREPRPDYGRKKGDEYGTMGVSVKSGNVRLTYDPVFICMLEEWELTYVLYHEILHIVLHHCTSRQFDNQEVGNIACDLAVNELIPIRDGSCVPPKDAKGKRVGCYVDDLKVLPQCKDIEHRQTAEYYYDYLMKKFPPKNGDPKLGNGRFDDHSGHAEDEMAAERVRAMVNDIESQGGWGDVSTAIKEVILAAQTRRINWRNILRQFYGNIAWPEREATRKRPNRRTGIVHPGYRRLQLDRHLVVADTSGSIDSDLLAQFLSIINQVSEQMPIDFMQVDCEKQTDPRPFDRRCVEMTFLGRGGTDFAPIMQMVEERHYKSVVILTDGEAGEVPKPSAEVVWVLPAGHNPPVDWGKRIHMERHI